MTSVHGLCPSAATAAATAAACGSCRGGDSEGACSERRGCREGDWCVSRWAWRVGLLRTYPPAGNVALTGGGDVVLDRMEADRASAVPLATSLIVVFPGGATMDVARQVKAAVPCGPTVLPGGAAIEFRAAHGATVLPGEFAGLPGGATSDPWDTATALLVAPAVRPGGAVSDPWDTATALLVAPAVLPDGAASDLVVGVVEAAGELPATSPHLFVAALGGTLHRGVLTGVGDHEASRCFGLAARMLRGIEVFHRGQPFDVLGDIALSTASAETSSDAGESAPVVLAQLDGDCVLCSESGDESFKRSLTSL